MSTLRARYVSVRERLGRFPMSILQLGLRVGVGLVFFKAGILKYQSFEFAVKLFQDEYKVPLLDPAVAARMATFNELTFPALLFLGLAPRCATLPHPTSPACKVLFTASPFCLHRWSHPATPASRSQTRRLSAPSAPRPT